MPIICEGCGQRVPIPEGYRRNKIQCACGVICAVPEPARPEADAPAAKRPAKIKPSSAVEEEAERWLLDEETPTAPPPSEPPRFRDAEPVAEAAPAAKQTANEMRFPCRRCGRLVRRQGECPDCNPDAIPATAKQEPVWWPSVDAPGDTDDEDEGPSSYGVEGGDDVKCPKCCFLLPPASVLCVCCGFHLTKRKKIAKTYQPIDRVWETNASYSTRLTLFGICTSAALAMGVTGILWRGAELGVFLPAFVVVAAMLAFLLGTFDRIHLTRDARGRVRLTKTWRLAFFARQPRKIEVRDYEGIVSGQHREVRFWEYLIWFSLLGFGIIPGIIWWYFVLHKVTFHVSLCLDHGFPESIVYSGWDQMQMKEIAYSLRNASGLPYEEG